MDFVQIILFTLLVGAIVLIFGIQYLKSKEKMALIEKNQYQAGNNKNSTFLLTCGIILIGIAFGIFVGIIINEHILNKPNSAVNILSILFFSGVASIISFYFNKKKS